jgi:hypothetical protein
MSQSQPVNRPIPDPVLSSEDALLEEYAAIIGDDWEDGKPRPRTSQWLRENEAELRAAPKTALCLSGGGIRGAAFCLGALQALAAKQLLGEFNYLSTVSGGSYIGAWLATIMHGGGRSNGALTAAIKALRDPFDPALRNLRHYLNSFVVPELRFGSSDAWTMLIRFQRLASVKWLVFGPVLLSMAMMPLLYRELLLDVSSLWGVIALLAGLACLLTGTIMGCRSVPTHGFDRDKDPKTHRYGVAASTAQRWIVAPVLAWTFLAPLWFSAASAEQADTVSFLSHTFAPASLGTFVVLLVGYGIAALTLPGNHRAAFGWNVGFWAIGAALSAFLLQLGMTLGQQMPVTTLVVLGPLWIIGAQVLHSTLYIGLRWTAAYGELDREWLARLDGEQLVPALAWSGLSTATLVVPSFVLGGSASGAAAWAAAYTAVIAFASGPIGVWLARRIDTLFGPTTGVFGGMTRQAVLMLLRLLFIGTMFMLLGWFDNIIVEQLSSVLADASWLDRHWLLAFVLIVLLVQLSIYCGARINVNRYSWHGFYRNRLARAFIGTARPFVERKPDAYTRFDPGDNVRMQELYQGKGQRGVLFPVVNLALNLDENAQSASTERKVAPFTITPLRAGAACLGEKDEQGDAEGRYVSTTDYAGQEHESGRDDVHSGITLGTAMAISGLGEGGWGRNYSSPTTKLLTTLFKVRLGAWLPNPAVGQRWSPGKPSNAVLPVFNEMLGRANDDRSDVYLTGGSDFDGLGLYEMLRRQCNLILVIDANADPDYEYADLGRVQDLARSELGADVHFITPFTKGEANLYAYGAFARIIYHDGSRGLLLYIKAWRPAELSPGMIAYWAQHGDFPHEKGNDLFFEESQFESYRSLGMLICDLAFANAESFPADTRLRQAFHQAETGANIVSMRARSLTPWQASPTEWKGPTAVRPT